MITITDSAKKHLKVLLEEKGAAEDTNQGLRLLVQKGGCAGMQYEMKIDAKKEGDHLVSAEDVSVFVDQESLEFLQGCEVDYTDSLTDTGFKIVNPNAARSCGCGTSFEPKEEGKAPEYDPTMDGAVCGEDS